MAELGDKAEDNVPRIDREKICPLLLRVFYNYNRHHRVEDYFRGRTPPNELKIYTWRDATLKELTSLIKEVIPNARKRGTYFDFALVVPNTNRQGHQMKDIGTTCAGVKGADDNYSLTNKLFHIGDFVDVAISIPAGPIAMRGRPNNW